MAAIVRADHLAKARWLVKEMREHEGLAPVDIEKFWADQAVAKADPFGKHIPQVALGVLMSGECVYEELGIPQDFWRYAHDAEWRIGLNKAYNDRAEKIVGRRLLPETTPDASLQYPERKTLADVFEAKNVWHDQSCWLQQSAHGEEELKALLDRVEERLARGLRSFILPPEWDKEKERLMKRGIKPPRYRGQRGPCTFATSIYGPEDFIMLMMDNPDLAMRLRDVILKTMLEIARMMDEENGDTPATSPRGFSFADDNSCLLNAEMYEMFGYPILKEIWETYSPGAKDRRYQHSDSPMGHHLPVLSRLDLTGTNFGPTLTVSEIRQYLPNAVIDGQLAPFTFMRNEEEKIVLEFLRDFEQAREKRGLRFATAGSINNGSRLTSMRLIMSVIQHFGRYEG